MHMQQTITGLTSNTPESPDTDTHNIMTISASAVLNSTDTDMTTSAVVGSMSQLAVFDAVGGLLAVGAITVVSVALAIIMVFVIKKKKRMPLEKGYTVTALPLGIVQACIIIYVSIGIVSLWFLLRRYRLNFS